MASSPAERTRTYVRRARALPTCKRCGEGVSWAPDAYFLDRHVPLQPATEETGPGDWDLRPFGQISVAEFVGPGEGRYRNHRDHCPKRVGPPPERTVRNPDVEPGADHA